MLFVLHNNQNLEAELVRRCLKHDRQAQQQLYEQYKRAMFTKAYRILNDYDHANDALQEAFVEIFRDLGTFRFTSTLGAWIKTIVIRKALQKQRLEGRFDSLHSMPDEPLAPWPDHLTGEILDRAIRELPDGYRAVFLLIEVEGYAHKETAEMLGISEGTSKSQLYHAKKLLRKKLSDLNV